MQKKSIINHHPSITLMHKRSRAQIAMEFLIVAGGVIFFASIILLTIYNNQEEKTFEGQNIQLKEIALTVQNEINLASKSTDGYKRFFKIPETAGTKDYEIQLDSGVVYIKTTDEKFALTLPVKEVTGQINKTQNKIEKINGIVYLNQ